MSNESEARTGTRTHLKGNQLHPLEGVAHVEVFLVPKGHLRGRKRRGVRAGTREGKPSRRRRTASNVGQGRVLKRKARSSLPPTLPPVDEETGKTTGISLPLALPTSLPPSLNPSLPTSSR